MNLAIFGGTFDPPHCGHLMIAQQAAVACSLNHIVLMPCRQSPHKHALPRASDEQRMEMLRLATASLPQAEVSDWELRRPGVSYSWQTAEYLAALHPAAKLHWIMGADQWLALPRWAHPEILARLLTFVVFPRAGLALQPREGFHAIFLTDRLDVSATEIRDRIGRGESISGLVPEMVERYIAEHRLYQRRR